MHTQISSKLAALAVALLMNSLLIVAVSQLQQPPRSACNACYYSARCLWCRGEDQCDWFSVINLYGSEPRC